MSMIFGILLKRFIQDVGREIIQTPTGEYRNLLSDLQILAMKVQDEYAKEVDRGKA